MNRFETKAISFLLVALPFTACSKASEPQAEAGSHSQGTGSMPRTLFDGRNYTITSTPKEDEVKIRAKPSLSGPGNAFYKASEALRSAGCDVESVQIIVFDSETIATISNSDCLPGKL